MTIQELLVKDGKWPDTDGPNENITRELVARLYTQDNERDSWVKMKQKVGKYTFSMWVYVPTSEVYADGAMLIEDKHVS